MEFVPSPIRFASDIFSRMKAAPTRWGGRLQGLGQNFGFLKNTAAPGLKNVKPRGVGLGGPIALLDAGVRVASGENPYLAGGRALSGWGGGVLGAGLTAPVPVPGARIAGGIGGYGAGTALFDTTVARATDDRGLSGLFRGKGWNSPFAPSPEAVRLAGDTDITSGTDMANVPVTEGSGTKLIQTENGTVMRVPVDQDLSGSTTIQTDLEPIENEINYDIIPKEESIRQGETAKAKWLYDTRNSPAARAGVFSDDERWALQQKDRDFQEAKRTGTLDEFAKKYPNSQTAKRRNWNPRMGRRS